METTCIFKRIEKKYLLSEERYESLFLRIGPHLTQDAFGRSTVMSLYLDTDYHRIIRNSLEAEDYKEKLRLRSYGTAGADSTVFLEIKKKYGGVVYKRRAAMTLSEAERYLRRGESAAGGNGAPRDQNSARHASVARGRSGRGEALSGQLFQIRRRRYAGP